MMNSGKMAPIFLQAQFFCGYCMCIHKGAVMLTFFEKKANAKAEIDAKFKFKTMCFFFHFLRHLGHI
jgi:hypothetical protein